MPNYPAQIDTTASLPTVVDSFTPISASYFNALRDAIIAIETAIGTNPSGIYSTLAGRLSTLETATNLLQASFIYLAGDLGGTLSHPLVIGLQNNPVSSVPPVTNDVLMWNGIVWNPFSADSISISGDVIDTIGASIVAGIQGNPVSGTTATAGQFLIENSSATGSAWTSISGDGYNSTTTPGRLIVSGINGTTVPNTPSANQVLVAINGVSSTWQTIVNANVNASAAIAGTKVNPNFGTQNILGQNLTLSGDLSWASGSTPLYGTVSVLLTSSTPFTLTGTQYNASIIYVESGSPFATPGSIILPLIAGSEWIIYNIILGGVGLEVQGASGTGIVIPSGKSATVWTDGTNIYDTTSIPRLPRTTNQIATLRWYNANNNGQLNNVSGFPTGVFFDGYYVWSTGSTGASVTRIAAQANSVVTPDISVSGSPYAGCYDGQFSWIANHGGSNVTKINANTGAIIGTSATGSNPRGICFDGTNIWTADGGGTTVTKITASTGTPVASYTIGTEPFGVCFDGTYIWATREDTSNHLLQIDPSDGAIINTFTVTSNNLRGVCFDGTYIWVVDDGGFTSKTLGGTLIQSYNTGSGPFNICFDGLYVWVASGDYFVTQINTLTGAQTQFTTPAVTQGICSDGTNVWVTMPYANQVIKF